jgi:hypothetical protein
VDNERNQSPPLDGLRKRWYNAPSFFQIRLLKNPLIFCLVLCHSTDVEGNERDRYI